MYYSYVFFVFQQELLDNMGWRKRCLEHSTPMQWATMKNRSCVDVGVVSEQKAGIINNYLGGFAGALG